MACPRASRTSDICLHGAPGPHVLSAPAFLLTLCHPWGVGALGLGLSVPGALLQPFPSLGLCPGPTSRAPHPPFPSLPHQG